MGEIAEDMIYGACCSHCCVHFKKEHGYPVLCAHCWKQAPPEDRKGHQRATHKEV